MSTHETPTLTAEARTKTGSRYARRLRDEGKLPAVVYGHGEGPASLTINAKTFGELLDTSAQLINLEIDGKAEPCLIRDVQYDHLHRYPVHADFTRVNLSENVTVEVELVTHGDPEALKEAGAVLNQEITALEVSCRADAIPDEIRVDISSLTGDSPITVGDITLPDGVTTDLDADQPVATIAIVKAAPEPDTEEADADAEPEVIEKGKADDESDADG
ncbi:MAG: 50S ribosomal protein L25 [Planctomycetota bacterium]